MPNLEKPKGVTFTAQAAISRQFVPDTAAAEFLPRRLESNLLKQTLIQIKEPTRASDKMSAGKRLNNLLTNVLLCGTCQSGTTC